MANRRAVIELDIARMKVVVDVRKKCLDRPPTGVSRAECEEELKNVQELLSLLEQELNDLQKLSTKHRK